MAICRTDGCLSHQFVALKRDSPVKQGLKGLQPTHDKRDETPLVHCVPRKAVSGSPHDELTETLEQSNPLFVHINIVAVWQGQLAYFDVPRLSRR